MSEYTIGYDDMDIPVVVIVASRGNGVSEVVGELKGDGALAIREVVAERDEALAEVERLRAGFLAIAERMDDMLLDCGCSAYAGEAVDELLTPPQPTPATEPGPAGCAHCNYTSRVDTELGELICPMCKAADVPPSQVTGAPAEPTPAVRTDMETPCDPNAVRSSKLTGTVRMRVIPRKPRSRGPDDTT